MGAAGRRRYEAKFTLDAMTRNTLAVYHSVLYGADAAAARAVTAHSREISVDLCFTCWFLHEADTASRPATPKLRNSPWQPLLRFRNSVLLTPHLDARSIHS